MKSRKRTEISLETTGPASPPEWVCCACKGNDIRSVLTATVSINNNMKLDLAHDDYELGAYWCAHCTEAPGTTEDRP